MLLKDKSKYIVGLDWTTDIRITPDVIEDQFDNYREPIYITKNIEGTGDELGMVSGSDVSGKAYCFAYYIESLIDEDSFVYAHRLAANEYYYLQVTDGVIESHSDKLMESTKVIMHLQSIDKGQYPIYLNQSASDELLSNPDELDLEHHVLDVKEDAKPPKSTLMSSSENKIDALKAHKPILLLLLALGVFLYFYLSEEEVEDVPLLAEIHAKEQAEIRRQQEQFINDIIVKHSTTPVPSQQINGCLKASLDLPNSLAGWLGDSISCSFDRSNKSYIRQPNTGHPEDFKAISKDYGLNSVVSFGKGGVPVGTASSQPFPVEKRKAIKLNDLPRLSGLQKTLNESFFPLFDSSCTFNETVGRFASPTPKKELDPDLNIAQVDYHVVCTSLSFFHEKFDLGHLDQPFIKFEKYQVTPKNSVISFKYLAR